MATKRNAHKHTKGQRFPLPLLLAALAVCGLLFFLRSRSEQAESPAPTEAPAAVTSAPEPENVPTPEPTRSPYADTLLRISEVCCVNTAMVPDEDGDFGDWVELENAGTADIELSGWRLSDKNGGGWVFPDGARLGSGERMLVFCDGKNRQGDYAHTDFSLRAGETVTLFDPTGAAHAAVSTEGLEKGQSAALQNDGSIRFSRFVTPGFENSDEGYTAWQESLACTSPLIISECVNSNSGSFFHYAGGGYNDWVEVCNVSSESVQTADYYLSDKAEDPTMWRLPSRNLLPGECWAFQCSGDESLSERYFTHTNFKIDNQAEGVYLFRADGALADYLYVHDVPCGGSIGRQNGRSGAFFMAKTTVHNQNEPGYRLYASNPVALTEDGVFNGVESVTLELSADKPIYYTTDGSVPTLSSPLYTAPLQITETSVVRAACCEEGRLTDRPLTLSYIINEGHEIPVASVVTERGNLFGGGIYDMWANFDGREVPASLSFYEDGGSFTVDCGLKMFGHTGLKNAKKSMKVLFRSRFGPESLSYDLYGDGNDTFTSLVLRGGQDCYFSVIRDELFQDLCAQFSDRVLVQRCRYCALYINGQYWGLYALKDAYSEDYYAALRGVSSESVTKVQAPAALGSDFYENVVLFAERNDMSLAENYEQFCSRVDMDSLIDWIIAEGYSANADVQQNLRYFRSTENGNLWELAFYDLDWAFYYPNNFSCIFYAVGEDGTYLQNTRYCTPLLQNAAFRERFCRRLAEALSDVYSEQNVLATIDRLQAEIAPEIPRDRARWSIGGSWEAQVESLRSFVRSGWTQKLIDGASGYCNLTDEEREAYFGSIEP